MLSGWRHGSCLAVDREGNDPFEARTSRAMAIVVDTRNLPQPWIGILRIYC